MTAEAGARIIVESDRMGRVHTAEATGQAQRLRFALEDGDHVLRITAANAAGGESPAVEARVTVDGTPPAPPSVQHRAPDAARIRTAIDITGEDGSSFVVRWPDGEHQEQTGVLAGGRAQVEAVLVDGSHRVEVVLTDPAGNASPPVVHQFEVAIPIHPAPTLSLDAEPGSPEVRFTVEGPPSGSAVVRAVAGAGSAEAAIELDEDGRGSGRLELPDGDYELVATAQDFQGRAAASGSGPIAHVVDTTPPDLQVSVDEGAAERGELAITITAEPGSRVVVQSDVAEIEGDFVAGPEPIRFEAETGEGSFHLTVTATDEYENRSVVEETVEVADPPSAVVLAAIGAAVAGLGALGLWKRRDLIATGRTLLARRRRS